MTRLEASKTKLERAQAPSSVKELKDLVASSSTTWQTTLGACRP